MTEVTLDGNAIAQLKDGQEHLKVRDAGGRVVGYFLPAQKPTNEVIFGVKSPFSKEELDRRIQRYRDGVVGARPLSEVLAEFERRTSGQSQ